jgi:hypothetical protein
MNKSEFKNLIEECVQEVLNESTELNEVNWQSLGQKAGKWVNKATGGNISGASKFGQKVGSKLDKTFKTQGHQQRVGNLDKANVKRNLADLTQKATTLINVARGVAKTDPTAIGRFTKEFDLLLKKYKLDKSYVEPSESAR